MDWEEFFKRLDSLGVRAGGQNTCEHVAVEELYQAFKARLMDEVAVTSDELLNDAELVERPEEE